MKGEKKITTPETKSFDEEYGKMMEEDIHKHQEAAAGGPDGPEQDGDEEPEPAEDEEEGGEEVPGEETAEPKKKKRRKKHGCLIVFIVFIAVIAIIAAANTPLLAVRNIEVEGNKTYSSSKVIQLSGIEKGDNLFRTSKKRTVEKLKRNSYIKTAVVKKKLPGTIILKITERKEAAYLPYGSRNIVTDSGGYVMKVQSSVPKLTEIGGMTVKSMNVGSRVSCGDQEMLSKCLEIISLMKKNDIFFKKLVPGKVLIKAYIYDDFMCRGTPENLMRSIKNGTLKEMLADLYKKKTKKGTLYIGSGDYISFSPKAAR